jgi:hypothetical protein
MFVMLAVLVGTLTAMVLVWALILGQVDAAGISFAVTLLCSLLVYLYIRE